MTDYASHSLPRGAVRAALVRAATWARGKTTVHAVGIGFKHREKAFVRPCRLCVKVVVRVKRNHPAERVPESFDVRYQGRLYRVPSDVEDLRNVVPQGVECFALRDDRRRGSLGALCHSGDGRSLALTAGHVLLASGPASIGNLATGAILSGATAFFDENSHFLDVGPIELDDFPVRFLQQPPWVSLDYIRPTTELWRLFPLSGGVRSTGLVFGAPGTVTVEFDALIDRPLRFPIREDPNLAYAPPLLRYRVIRGRLARGYSGAAVTDPSGVELLGIHVLGTSQVGYAQGAGLLVSALRARLNRSLVMY